MTSAEFAKRIEQAKEPYSPDGWWSGRCPAHDDENPSLGWKDGDKKIGIKCQAGCTRGQVLAALNLTEDDTRLAGALTVERLAEAKGFTADYLRSLGVEQRGDSVLVRYRLADGSEAGRHQLRRAGAARFAWIRGPGEPVPYGLWRLGEARAQGYLLLVEGASDCWAAWLRGVPALGLPGASSARLLAPEHLVGVSKVYVVREPDAGGDAFAAGVAARLRKVGFTGMAYELRMPGGLKDVNELHLKCPDADDFLGQLRPAVEAAPKLEAPAQVAAPEPAAAGKYERTPGGNRDRLVDAFGKDIAYATGIGWLDWTGKRWKRDVEELYLQRRAEAVVQQLREEAAALAPETKEEKAAALAARAWYLRCHARAPMREMVELARSSEGVLREQEEFDARRALFCCENGVIDLATGEFREHRREDLITYISPARYDPQAAAPRWEQFVREVMRGDLEMVAYLQRLVGYCMTGEVSEDAFFIFYGTGSNGKTTFLEVLRAVMGYDYAKATPAATFLKRRDTSSSGASPEIARLRGTRLVTAVEVERAQRLATGMVKAAAGGDRQVARFLYQELMEFDGQFKVILAVNNKPAVHDQSKGMWRRVHLVPWEAVFEEGTPGFDKYLDRKLLAELPGILNWCAAGARQWFERGLAAPTKVLAATREYREEQDDLGEFFENQCAFGRGKTAAVATLHKAYVTWCDSAGEKPMSKKVLTQVLAERGVKVKKSRVLDPRRPGRTMPASVYLGIELVPDVPDVPLVEKVFSGRPRGAGVNSERPAGPGKTLAGSGTPGTPGTLEQPPVRPEPFYYNAYTPVEVLDLMLRGKDEGVDLPALVQHIEEGGPCDDPSCLGHAAYVPLPDSEREELLAARADLMEPAVAVKLPPPIPPLGGPGWVTTKSGDWVYRGPRR